MILGMNYGFAPISYNGKIVKGHFWTVEIDTFWNNSSKIIENEIIAMLQKWLEA